MSGTDTEAIAREILAATRDRTEVEPLTERYPGLDLHEAYRVQLAQVRERTASGARITGHKIGLTSAAMQRQLGVLEPDFGHLYDDMEIVGDRIDVGRFIAPRAEPEIAFVLKRDLTGPGVTARDALAAVDHVLPALEIIDSRIRDWRIGLPDTVADNASSGAYLLGNSGADPRALDLARLGCVLREGTEIIASGSGSAALGHPLNALVWLANALGALDTTLAAGEIVLSGSLTAAVPLRPGTTLSAQFQGLGHISLHVEGSKDS
ncbi:2-keto-4-pentenoate hydratase [Streptomyces sp. KS_5]|uniref:2-keto-4-pentenoate hydratase n=1 Tax=Streptomyces sp. KS_5 TaxID=1881018 RepID=UPI0008949F49|nr:fumarylacetoacetate hydrolase family protein [Streptomyces sp. KS_5]SEE35792.1 2-keto-4-pentenoate hydratase [Streptomyces sp. KS_5]